MLRSNTLRAPGERRVLAAPSDAAGGGRRVWTCNGGGMITSTTPSAFTRLRLVEDAVGERVAERATLKRSGLPVGLNVAPRTDPHRSGGGSRDALPSSCFLGSRRAT